PALTAFRRFFNLPVMRLVSATSAFAAVIFLATATRSASLRAEEPAGGSHQETANGETGNLLLQDGGVPPGQITHAATSYIVDRGGGQLQVAESRVLTVCRTLEDAYAFRRQQLSGSNATAHLELAEWCLRYNLLADAGCELADARQLDPDHPRLRLL